MNTGEFLNRVEVYLKENNFQIDRNKRFADPRFSADIYASRKFKKSVFSSIDYLFIHDLSSESKRNREHLADLHEKARTYVNSLFKLPRYLRWKIPNIITAAVSAGDFSNDMVEYVRESTFSIIGGEKHSLYLVDLAGNIVISQILEEIEGFTFNVINPVNRAYHMVREMHRYAAGLD